LQRFGDRWRVQEIDADIPHSPVPARRPAAKPDHLPARRIEMLYEPQCNSAGGACYDCHVHDAILVDMQPRISPQP
jgi:hypothetical protein